MSSSSSNQNTYIMAVGLSHKSATVDLREKLAVNADELEGVLKCICGVEGVTESVLLSTCNRIELYLAVDAEKADAASSAASCLCELKGADYSELRRLLKIYERDDAVRHLFEVASGLDSMVPGENEVLAQVKTAYISAQNAGHCGSVLDAVFQRALRVAKEVRTSTGIAGRKVSVSSIALDLTKRVFGDLSDTSVALLGAGNMAELTVKALEDANAKLALVASRSIESAESMAKKYGVRAFKFDQLDASVLNVDVIISSAAADKPIITMELLGDIEKLRRGKPLLIIDLGVPRNVEASSTELEDVILYNIDDFKSVVDSNIEYRLGQVDEASKIIDTQYEQYVNRLMTNDVTDVICALSDSYRDIGRIELERSMQKLGEFDEVTRKEIEHLVHRIINKTLHTPITQLKDGAKDGTGEKLSEAAKRIFGL